MSSWSTASSSDIPLATIKSVARLLTLSLAILATGLISGYFYAYACSVTLGLAPLPDEQYVEAMRAINATVRNGMLAFGFFGTVSSLLLALAVHVPQLRSRRFVFMALVTERSSKRRLPNPYVAYALSVGNTRRQVLRHEITMTYFEAMLPRL